MQRQTRTRHSEPTYTDEERNATTQRRGGASSPAGRTPNNKLAATGQASSTTAASNHHARQPTARNQEGGSSVLHEASGVHEPFRGAWISPVGLSVRDRSLARVHSTPLHSTPLHSTPLTKFSTATAPRWRRRDFLLVAVVAATCSVHTSKTARIKKKIPLFRKN